MEKGSFIKKHPKAWSIILSLILTIVMIIFPVTSGVITVIRNLNTIEGYWLQGFFMTLSIIVPMIYIKGAKISLKQIGFRGIKRGSSRMVLYFLPLIIVKIPYLFYGIENDADKIIALIYFTIVIGVSEEIYFRGIILRRLLDSFTIKQSIIISALFFAMAHASQAFSGIGMIMVVLTVVNALIFGIITAELLLITESIIPLIIWHILYDFINWSSFAGGLTKVVIIAVESAIIIAYACYLWIRLPKRQEN